jgi:hypothetical protein
MDVARPAHVAKHVAFALILAAGVFVDACVLLPSLDDRLRVVEGATVVQYMVLAGVSVFAAQWPVVMLFDALVGVAYLVATRWKAPRLLGLRAAVVGASRGAGHLEALFPWVVLSVAGPWPLVPWTLRGAMLGGCLFYAPGWIDALTHVSRRRGWLRAADGADDLADHWRFRVQRRLVLLAASVLGFVLLGAMARSQVLVVLPLLAAFLVGVLFRVAELRDDPRRSSSHGRRAVIERALRSAQHLDLAFLVVSQVALAWLLWAQLHAGAAASDADQRDRNLPERRVPAEAAPAAPSPRAGPPIRLFVLADSQLHELSGVRAGVHLDMVHGIVPVAVRPVELDLLSVFTVARFERARRDLERAYGQPLPWVHLGDFGDLGCESEIERMTAIGAAMAPPLAIVPGNHDNAFCGNFAWHPSWDPACGTRPRATKAWADETLHAWSRSSEPMSDLGSPYMPAAVPLGRVGGKEVLGVFVDTSDFTMPSLGVAGIQGEISRAQEVWIDRALDGHPQARVVFFLHHPVAELSALSRWRMGRIVDHAQGRVVGLVSAHTHLAALRWTEAGARHVPELVVGSTIDPPQEAALLEIGENEAGRVAMRLTTLPAVARNGETCREIGARAVVEAATCDGVWRDVQARCPWLTAVQPSRVHPRTPDGVKAEQQARAVALLRCLPELGLPAFSTSPAPLDDEGLTPAIDAAARRLLDPAAPPSAADDLDRLACLSWAGAVLQGRSTASAYADALAGATRPDAASTALDMLADDTGGTQRACGATSPRP